MSFNVRRRESQEAKKRKGSREDNASSLWGKTRVSEKGLEQKDISPPALRKQKRKEKTFAEGKEKGRVEERALSSAPSKGVSP